MTVVPPKEALHTPPILSAVLQSLADVDTVPVAVLAVEIWPTEVLVRLVGLPWNATEHGQSPQPGELPAIAQLRIKLTDANGADMVWQSASSGGGGDYGRWRIDHSFVRTASSATQELVVSALTSDGTEVHAVKVVT